MEKRLEDGVVVITHLGWFWNPFEKRWEHDLNPCAALNPRGRDRRRTLIGGYDLDNPPRYSPFQLSAG